jgi:GT2 family glycosyltransferase
LDYDNVETIVVDCLTPGIEAWTHEYFPWVKLIHLTSDVGPSAQRNIGWRVSDPHSRYVAFVDNDIVVEKGCLRRIIRLMEEDCLIGAAQPIIGDLDDRVKIDSCGGSIDRFGFPCKPKARDRGPTALGIDILYAESAFLVIPKSLSTALPRYNHPFDPDFFIHWEDIDLSWLVWLAGYRVVLVPEMLAYNERRASGALGRLRPRHIFLNSRNKVGTLIKNYSSRDLAVNIPAALLLEFARAMAVLPVRADHSLAIFQALASSLFDLRIWWRKHLDSRAHASIKGDLQVRKLQAIFSMRREYQSFKAHYGSPITSNRSQSWLV